MHLGWYSSGTHAVTVTVGRKNRAAGRKGRKKCGETKERADDNILKKSCSDS